jgi:SAM-dependent methyltransferase
MAPVQANITQYWHMHAPAYDAHPMSQLHMGAAKDAWARVWRGALPSPPCDVLDVGTGTGQVALLLAELGYCVTGIDLAEGMLELARAKGAGLPTPPTLQLGDAVDPPFPPAGFDAITNRYLLWTLREPARALANWHRLLRPGGRLVAVDSTWYAGGIPRDGSREAHPDGDEFLRLNDEEVVAALPLAEAETIEAMAALVREAGFRDVAVTPLYEMERIQREALPDAGNDLRLQFLITAVKE